MVAATRNAFACIHSSWPSIIFLSWFVSSQAWAIEAPLQTDYPYFEDDRYAYSSDLNGRTFEAGFTFSGWFQVKKFRSTRDGIVGFGAESFLIEMEPSGNLTIWFKEVPWTFSDAELDQWVNLAVTAGEGQVRFYKNGELVHEEALADTSVAFPQNEGVQFILGGFWGYVKQFKIWETALSQAALQAEIAVASSEVNIPAHQWLMDEGVGSEMRDTGTLGGTAIDYENVTIWKNIHSPYEILLESEFHVYGEVAPGGMVWGSVDFDQDGVKEVFLHGGEDTYYPDYNIPMLILQIDENQRFVDASDSLIDGGTYYKAFPSGRDTIVADLNGDGFDDIFSATTKGHLGSITPEHSVYLLSDGASGMLYPSEHKIMSPPCTLVAPAYEGQKPCQTSDSGGIVYPDENAPLVSMSQLDNGHATSSGDIDRDGDIDLYVQTIYGGERDETPVTSYFLINDGAGNFTANWQLVPYKAFKYDSAWFEDGELPGQQEGFYYVKDLYYNFGKLSDFDQDGYLDLALTSRWDESAELLPPDHPFDVETETPQRSVYELIAWGDENGFSEEYTILWPEELPTSAYRGGDTAPFAIDFDNDGDNDLIINRNNDQGYPGSWLQVFRNEGGRVFKDVTATSLPQTLEEVSVRTQPVDLKPYDLNQDGCTDFISTIESSPPNLNGLPPFRIWLNDCNGRFSPVRDSLFGKMGMMVPLDVDGDGGLDFVSIVNNHDPNGINGFYREFTILKQVAPIDVSHFTEISNIEINAGHSGAWFNPDTSGQGQLIDIESESQFMFLAWFAYTDVESGHPNEQHWLTAQGTYSGDTAVLPVYETLGGKFDDPQAVSSTAIGSMELTFSDCANGLAHYIIDSWGVAGTIPLSRVVPGSENVCSGLDIADYSGLVENDGWDGAWYDPETAGQGFLIEVQPNPGADDFIFIAWFTYGDTNASGQRWLTAQGSLIGSRAEIPVYETTGGSFDAPTTVSSEQIGTMSIQFNNCNSASLTYELPNESLSGSIDIVRVVPGTEALCEDLASVN